MYPLLCNPDEHVLATLGSLVLALVEGRTDLPLSGMFGAGKTRSAAILVVGPLVFEPSLNLMILTKENVAAQAFAEHIESLALPECVSSKIGRLVGEMYAAASGACDSVLIVGILKWMFDAFFQIHLYLDSAAARGIINRRGVGKVCHLSCRSLWLRERMADGSLVVSPVSGTTNPADIGTKRLNVNRMSGLMFLLGMFDSVNSCHVGEIEAHSIIHHQVLRKAMQSVRRLVKCEDSPLRFWSS